MPSDSLIPDVLRSVADLQNHELKTTELLQKLLEVSVLQETVNNFEDVLADAVRKRVECLLSSCKNCYSDCINNSCASSCKHSYVGVLFSGGLDSIVIASLADRYVLI